MAKTAKTATMKPAKAGPAKQPAVSEVPASRKAAPTMATAAATATISLKQMAAGLAESHELPKRQVEALLGEFVQTFSRHLKKGSKIRLNGLGIFQVRARPARMERNPATGEPIKIKASKKIAFRPAKELKEAV
ncbi:HU family DNA-binding protein [Siccirubricoccus sp. G192]|uniref:HU family DNA-binding protein n=1 Tax=Siccirubricoccus sp. G192 TaxID=2849651 RepID=UPI0027387697|nr:HU family DNA-binding protein [Siccirubricoccus sp. G192]